MGVLIDPRMPGVYTNEVATLPPSVAAIESAVPVFIGYTEMAMKKGEDLTLVPTRIKSMKEYQDYYGGPPLCHIEVSVDTTASATNPTVLVTNFTLPYNMYYALLFYFANGGGPLYIVSVGAYGNTVSDTAMTGSIPAIKKVRDITILYFPDACLLADAKHAGVINAALQHCEGLFDPNRVTIIDVSEGAEGAVDTIATFMSGFINDAQFRKYGAAYAPFCDTVFTPNYVFAGVIVSNHIQTVSDAVKAGLKALSDDTAAKYTTLTTDQKKVNAWQITDANVKALQKIATDFKAANPAATNAQVVAALEASTVPIGGELKKHLDAQNADPVAVLTEAAKAITDLAAAQAAYNTALTNAAAGFKDGGKTYISYTSMDLTTVATVSDLTANKIKDTVDNYGVVLPPGGAVAGIYYRTDNSRGVWKAPANVTVVGAIAPMVNFDDDDHSRANVPDNGRAVNLIRNYPGRGVLLYGARTLLGNDNEWRYVNVRRTFCFIEDSVYRAMQDFVFEPNTSETWIKVRAMINAFLNKLWKAGGLFGATPEDAYDVQVGLPNTMSVDDVLNGIMIVYIKVAVARPAEFIELIYEHKFAVPQS